MEYSMEPWHSPMEYIPRFSICVTNHVTYDATTADRKMEGEES